MNQVRRHAAIFPALTIFAFAPVMHAQVKILSDPGELLTMTRDWSRASTLGDLRERAESPGYVELRAWMGYGLFGTGGVIVRREHGVWSAWSATLVRCQLFVQFSIYDTASNATRARFRRAAHHHCGASVGNVSGGSNIIDADTLSVNPLHTSPGAIEAAYRAAITAGAMQLPEREPANIGLDGLTYIVEQRQNGEYRGSQIWYTGKPGAPGEAEVLRVVADLFQLTGQKGFRLGTQDTVSHTH